MVNTKARATSVDAAEVERFSRHAPDWWDARGPMAALHKFNPVRLGYIRDKATAHFARDPKKLDCLKGLRMLDIGCGGGILAESMAAHGATVTGIDLGDAPLAVAKLHLKESGQKVDYHKISAEDLAREKPESFDVVTCMEMLEHVPDPASTVAACAKLVKPGGQVFFSTINRNPKSWLFAIVGAEYVLNLLPKGTHEYMKFIKPSELERWTRHAGLTLRELIGMHYNPLTRRYRLGRGVDVNYIAYTTRGE